MRIFTCLLFLLCGTSVYGQIVVTFPPARMVYQRNQAGNTKVYVTGTYTAAVDRIEARLNTRSGEPGAQIGWTEIANPTGNVFSGFLTATGGRYDLEVRGIKDNVQVGSTVTVEKVGVGEVFLIVGHSNAAAAESEMVGATSDLVNSINPMADMNLRDRYLNSGSADDLPPLQPTALCQTCGIAPMGEYPWFWSRLGDLLVNSLQVPVLFYGAAFGGSNMGSFYKSAYNLPFDHGFIKYSIRMPYTNVRNAMNKYVPRTGIRAILSGHGVNDLDTTRAGFVFRSEMVIAKSREEANYPNLAWMIATSCYNDGVKADITAAQNDLIDPSKHIFRGADLNQIDNSGRYDKLHFNEAGQIRAAELWRDAIMDGTTNLMANAQVLMAQQPTIPGPPLPVTLVSFAGKLLANGRNELEWVTGSETNNDYFEILKSTNAVNFTPVGNVKGVGDSRERSVYSFTDESPDSKVTYYRLKQVDYDGTFSLSKIIAVRAEERKPDEYVFPNPAEHYLEVVTDNGSAVEDVVLFDLTGKVVLSKSKSNQIDISSLQKGDYLINIKMNSGQMVSKKIAKQ
jgi:hypothetical protein